MKTTILTTALFTFMLMTMTNSTQAQSAKKQIQEVIITFAQAGDDQDVAAMSGILSDQYRILLNDPSKSTVIEMNRETYLSMIESKKFGGDKRKVKIESVEIYDDLNAMAKVYLDGEKADLLSMFSLVKLNGKWQLAQDLVLMKMN